MSDLPLIIQISTTPAYILGFFIFFTLLFHFLLLKKFKFSEVWWKRIDYLWLTSAVIGLLIISLDLNRHMSQSWVNYQEEPRTKSEYEFLRRHLEIALPVCIEYPKGQFSPPESDEMAFESKALCEQSKAMFRAMPLEISHPFPSLEQLGIKKIGYIAKFNTDYVNETNNYIDRYSKQLQTYNELNAAANSPIELYKIFGSLFLAIALALRFTKVTAEVKQAKAKKANP